MKATRSQQDMKLAHDLVSTASGETDQCKKIYGGLCHSFPVMVVTCGLCQAVAFHAHKAASDGDRGKAHSLLLQHVARLLGVDGQTKLIERVRDGTSSQYRRDTRRVLTAWIFFKRFAASVLGVESARAAEDTSDGD